LERDIPFLLHAKKGKTIQETQLTYYKEVLENPCMEVILGKLKKNV